MDELGCSSRQCWKIDFKASSVIFLVIRPGKFQSGRLIASPSDHPQLRVEARQKGIGPTAKSTANLHWWVRSFNEDDPRAFSATADGRSGGHPVLTLRRNLAPGIA